MPALESDELLLWQLEGLLVARVAHEAERGGEGDGDSGDDSGGGGGVGGGVGGGGGGAGAGVELRAGEVIGRVRGVVPREELPAFITLT